MKYDFYYRHCCMKTKLFSLFVALFATISVSAKIITEGTCGDNLRWAYDSTSYTLTITGSGAMEDYRCSLSYYCEGTPDAPWYGYKIRVLSLPNDLTSIGRGAFADCADITSLTIPVNVKMIGFDAFTGCTEIDSVFWNAKYCDTESGWGWHGSPFASSIENIVFGNEVQQFPCCLGQSLRKLTTVIIPNNITYIGADVFSYSGLISLTIPDNVTCISKDFNYCPNLVSVNIGRGLTEISGSVFASCEKLGEVTLNTSVPPILNRQYSSNVFSDCPNLKVVHIPCGTKEAYIAAGWGELPLKEPDPKWSLPVSSEDVQKGDITIIDAITCRNYMSSFSATANYGYHFTQWSDGNTDNPRSVEVTQDTVFTAEFALNRYSVTTAVGGSTGGSTLGDTLADYLSVVTLTATPYYGYHFASWSDGNTDNPRTIQVTRDSVFSVVFDKNTYSVTLLSSDPEKGTILGPNQSEYLSNITIEAQPNYGYHFTRWSDGNTENPRSVEVTQDSTFIAEFAPNKYSIFTSVDVFMGGGVTIGDTVADYMSSVTITAVPNIGYHFIGWSDGNRDNPRTIQVTQDIHLTAFFGQYSIYGLIDISCT